MPSSNGRLRAGLYLRVSSEEQAGEGKTSIDTQRADGLARATQLGWLVVDEYLDARRYRAGTRQVEPSGTRTDRPQWKRLLADLTSGRINAVIAWHTTRLYRGYRPALDFLEVVEAHDVAVELVKDQFNRRFAMLQAWLAREENQARTDRTRMGQAGRARKGMTATRTTPYYKALREPDTGEVLGYEFDEHYRQIFDEMARLFLQRISYREIHKRLGLNPRTGRPWGPETIRTIIGNPYYRGLIAYGRRARKAAVTPFVTLGRHKPVWDEATCKAIEIEWARRQSVGPHAPRSRLAPFAGVLRCAYCGHLLSPTMPGKGRTTRDGRPYRYYDCYHNRQVRAGYQLGVAHAPNGIAEQKLLRLLRFQLAAWSLADVDELLTTLATIAPAHHGDDTYTLEQLALAEKQVAELERERKRLRSDLGRAALQIEIDRLSGECDVLRDTLARNTAPATLDLAAARAAMLHLIEHPEALELPDAELRLLVRTAFPTLWIQSGKIVPHPAQ